MSSDFAHLHVHTEYSMLDGAAKHGPLFAEAARLGQSAVAMTDHGNMFGAYSFWKSSQGTGVKPVMGIEAYVAPGSRHHKKPVQWGRGEKDADAEGGKDIAGAGAYLHLTMWALDATGLRNLFKLSTLASFEGHYRKPRMDLELMAAHSQGVAVSTGCPSGGVQTRLRLRQFDEATAYASDLRDIFGPGNVYLELMDHGLDIERQVRDGLLAVGRQLSLEPLVTNDAHYVAQADHRAHDALLAVGVGKNLDDPNRFRFDGDHYYLKSADRMLSCDTSEAWVRGCANTAALAARVDSDSYAEVFAHRDDLMPAIDVPEGHTQSTYLRAKTREGAHRRYGSPLPARAAERMEHELSVIDQMGYPAYFLVVADICDYARRQGIALGPGRGSAAGSLVAYALGITELCPLEHDLLFERFLNPERVSMPDIDLDFDERRRSEIIDYVSDAYGQGTSAMINTFGTIKAKAAVKDAARVLGKPFGTGDRITKAFPAPVGGEEITLDAIDDPGHERYAEAEPLRKMASEDPEAAQVLETARGLEGLVRGTGVHAAGVILSAVPLADVIPLRRRDSDGAVITGFDCPQCEDLGLLKMDLLGLRNLTTISDTLDNIRRHESLEVDLRSIPMDDGPTFDLLARGDTLGVFQLDGNAMRALLRRMRPTRFEDVSAVLALYRPGPMGVGAHNDYADRSNGRQRVEPIHPELEEVLEPILGPTHHLIVYQEQVMAIAQEVAGYTLGGADLLRRAMGKKKKEALEAEQEKFFSGAAERGYSEEATRALWDTLLPFSSYAFNKSHTAGYGLVAYWTAYLKANHPAAYMAALLTGTAGDKDKVALYLSECRRMGIRVLPPDVSASESTFTPSGKSEIRFGLSAVRGVGAGAVRAVIDGRTEGPYRDFSDFLARCGSAACTKRVVAALVQAGAFDSTGATRRDLFAAHEQAVSAYAGDKKKQSTGQFDLFADDGTEGLVGVEIPETGVEWPPAELLARERQMLGLYVSSHPLAGAEKTLEAARDTTPAQIAGGERSDGARVRTAGLVSDVEHKVSKKGNGWARAVLEDEDGASVEVLLFGETYTLVHHAVVADAALVVDGQVREREGQYSVIARSVTELDTSSGQGSGEPLRLRVGADRVDRPLLRSLSQALSAHPGTSPVHLYVTGTQGRRGPRTLVYALPGFRVRPGPALKSELKHLFGPGALEEAA